MGAALVHLFLAGGIAFVPLILLLILFAALGDKSAKGALGCVVLIIGAVIVIYFLFSNY